MAEKKVKPVDNVTVYAKGDKQLGIKAGQALEVHSVQAEKLIAAGKAFKTEAEATAKPDVKK